MTAFLFLVLLMQLGEAQSDWRGLETTSFNWARSDISHVFILEERTTEEAYRLRIQAPDKSEFVFPVPYGFVRLEDERSMKDLAVDNLLRSSYLYMSPRLRDRAGRPMLVVLGDARASNPGSLTILAVDRKSRPKIVLNFENFELTATEDVDGDGRPEIIGLHSISQALTQQLSTYDPFSVYRLNLRTDKAVFSLALSRAYNLKRYAWAGPKGSEKILAVQCPGKDRPLLMTAARAYRFIEKGGCRKH